MSPRKRKPQNLSVLPSQEEVLHFLHSTLLAVQYVPEEQVDLVDLANTKDLLSNTVLTSEVVERIRKEYLMFMKAYRAADDYYNLKQVYDALLVWNHAVEEYFELFGAEVERLGGYIRQPGNEYAHIEYPKC